MTTDERNAVVEECAKVADDYANRSGQSKADKIHAAFEIAQRIRALSERDGSSS